MPWKPLRTCSLGLVRVHTDCVAISKGKSDLILAAVLRMERFLEHMDSKIVSHNDKLPTIETVFLQGHRTRRPSFPPFERQAET
jgi:hypothetical protein